jgi:hypothetical protein
LFGERSRSWRSAKAISEISASRAACYSAAPPPAQVEQIAPFEREFVEIGG